MNFNSIQYKIKSSLLSLSLVCAALLASFSSQAQGPTPSGLTCIDAIPFCTGTTYNFPNQTNGVAAPSGLGYACLFSQPNPVWYYMKIANPGTMQISVAQFNAGGGGIDVDFAMWGPFTSLLDACTAINGGTLAIQSSYSSSATETVGIGLPGGVGGGAGCATTPPNAVTGQFYVLLLTNFSNQAGNITFSQTAGTATTDCTIITCGVDVTSNSPICQGDSAYITTTNTNDTAYVYNYYWTGSNGFTSNAKSPAIGGLLAGTYSYHVDAVTQLPNNDYDTCSKDIEIIVNPTFKKFLTEYICAGDSVFWYDKYIRIAGDYDSLFQTENGCDSLVRTTLNVIPRPSKIFMADSLIACQYDSVALESNAIPFSASYTYNWSPSTNLNQADQPNVWFMADQSRSYVLTVTNTVNNIPCSLKDTVDIIVNPGDFLQVPIVDTGLCPSYSVQLNATGASQYKWSPPAGLSNPNIANPIAHPEVSTVYRLIGTSDKGCTDTQMVNITVHPAAIITLPDSIHLYPGEVYAMEPGTNATFFHWFPNSGINNVNIANPLLNPDVDTRYFVTAKTEFGCEVSDSVDVWVKATVIDMPNAFNPNTETFKPLVRGLVSIERFAVYNRWGEKVFESQDQNQGWNGYYKNVAQPMGAYVYEIIATTSNGKKFKQTGSITLVR